jgi:hypothetical protein
MATYGQSIEESESKDVKPAEVRGRRRGGRRRVGQSCRRCLKATCSNEGAASEQKFTQPPARFSERRSVKSLRDNGIGRPSTVRVDHRCAAGPRVRAQGRRPVQAVGARHDDHELLTKSFDDIIDVEYTRSLEDDLDKIEQGTANYERTLGDFYKKFKKDLARAGKEMDDLKKGIEIGEACDKCGSPMLKRVGKFGPFIACSAYPECTIPARSNSRSLSRNRARKRSNRARTAASRWPSSVAASVSSLPAPGTPSARRRGS